ncbi:MAG: L-threonylcarbamoyladenylate synthase [Candidatus Portnoybacteria bacterium]
MNLEIIKLNPNNISLMAQKAADVLKSGGIVIHPTDTCYGIAADASNPRAVKKIYQFKGRDYKNPLFIILPDFNQFKKYGQWHSLIEETIRDNSKKMFTFVVPQKKNVLPRFNPGFKTIGIQIPNNPFSLAMLKKSGLPIAGTSANLSGMRNNYSVRSLIKQIGAADIYPDLIIDGGRLSFKKPSSVVEIKEGKINYLRK